MQEVQIQALVRELRPACHEMSPKKFTHYIWGVWVSEGSPFNYFLCGLVLLSRLPRPVMLGEKKKRLLGCTHPVELLMGPPTLANTLVASLPPVSLFLLVWGVLSSSVG